MGPPGTGKTLLAKAIAGEAGVPFFSISGSDFVEMFVGVGASRVRDLFEQGKKHAPCIVFIDEIDAVGRHRGAGLGGGHDEREQTLNQLLVEMDGFESNEGVILIAATNRPDVLDPALLRPGRFDRRVVVSHPDVRGREEILKVHTRKTPMGAEVDLSIIARGTPGFSGADLENLVNEAALLAARENKKYLELHDFEHAKDKVLMGVERKSMVLSDNEKRTTAYHEAGHTLVGKFMPGTDPIHKVTIIPRGMALGVTQTLPNEDRMNLDRVKAENSIAFLMGGRVAEEIVLNQKTTGAGNDIERATDLARRMVCEWGMSDVLGPMTFGKKEEAIFLGREIGQNRDYSEQTAQTIDREIRDIVERNYRRAREILSTKVDILHSLAAALLEHETLDGADVDLIVQGLKVVKKPTTTGGSGGNQQEPVSSAAAGKKEPGKGGGATPAPVLA
jgi:cell division protease FtsH